MRKFKPLNLIPISRDGSHPHIRSQRNESSSRSQSRQSRHQTHINRSRSRSKSRSMTHQPRSRPSRSKSRYYHSESQ